MHEKNVFTRNFTRNNFCVDLFVHSSTFFFVFQGMKRELVKQLLELVRNKTVRPHFGSESLLKKSLVTNDSASLFFCS